MGNTSSTRIRDSLERDPQFNQYLQTSVVNTIQPLADNYGMDLGKAYGSEFGKIYGTQISKQLQKQTQTFEQQFARNFSQQFMNEFSRNFSGNIQTPANPQTLNVKPSGLYIPGPIQSGNYQTLKTM